MSGVGDRHRSGRWRGAAARTGRQRQDGEAGQRANPPGGDGTHGAGDAGAAPPAISDRYGGTRGSASVECPQEGASQSMEARVMGSTTSLTWPIPAAAKARSASAMASGGPSRGQIQGLLEVTGLAPGPAWHPDEDRHGPLESPQITPTSAHAASTTSLSLRRTRRGRCRSPNTSCSTTARAASSIRSIRHPSSRSGAADRPAADRAADLAVAGLVERPSKSIAPSRSRVRMMVNASSNRSIR